MPEKGELIEGANPRGGHMRDGDQGQAEEGGISRREQQGETGGNDLGAPCLGLRLGGAGGKGSPLQTRGGSIIALLKLSHGCSPPPQQPVDLWKRKPGMVPMPSG